MAAAAPAWASPVVNNVRLGQHPDRTRVVLDLSEAADYELIPQDGGHRLVIELPDSEWNGAPDEVAALGLVDRVTRFRRASGTGLRIVLDIDGAAQVASDYILSPEAGRPYRLVVDLKAAGQPPVSDPGIMQDAAEMAGPEAPEAAGEPGADMAAIEGPEPVFPDVPEREPAPGAPPEAASPPANRSGPVMMMAQEGGGAAAAPPSELPGAPPPISLEGVRQDWSGYLEGEIRLFPSSVPGKSEVDGSLAGELHVEASWNNGMQSFTFVPFGRVDAEDGNRTHGDIRELKWTGVFGDVEMRVGLDRVFWGVTESVHLVNVINQIDGVEDVDNEDLLGQPLASLSLSRPFGTVTAYILPYFRERTFAGGNGRPGRYPVAEDMAQFGSPHDDWRTDWAVRYAHAAGPFDIGLAHFHGMDRTPYLIPTVVNGETVLIPRYEPVDRTSLDLQGTFGALLLKFEGVTADGPAGPWGERYWTAAGGFEYTVFNVFGGKGDLGFLAEYIWDERDANANTPFEDDLFVGMRWSGNNVGDSQFLAGAIVDLDGDAVAANVEASQRLWKQWRLSLDARLFLDVRPTDPLYIYSRDDFLQLRLDRFF